MRGERDGRTTFVEQQGWAAPDSASPSASGGSGSATPGRGPSRPDPTEDSEPTRSGARAHGSPPRLPVPLRPMTLSDLLDGSFAVMKSRPRTVFTIAAVILVPVHLIAAFAQRDVSVSASIDNFTNALNTGQSTPVSDSQVLASYGALALLAVSLFFLGGAIGRLVSAWYAGGDMTAGEALGAAFRRTPALVAAFLMLLPLKMLGLVGCYVGVILPVTLFSLTAPALVVEGIGPVAAARRSWRLIARRFWFCILVVLLAVLGSGLLTNLLAGVPTYFAGLLPSPFDWITTAAISTGVSMIVTTALVSMSVLLYLDLRIRTEGLDIELEAADAFARAR